MRTVDRSNTAAPIGNKQKQILAMTARRAYERLPCIVRGETKFDLWRHAEAIKVCGRRISHALQGDYLPLKAHFLELSGDSVGAMRAHMRRENEPERVALHKLRAECADRDLPLSYADSICRRQYRTPLEQASEKQIWSLVFTIRNRRKPTHRPDPEDDNEPF